VVFRCHLTCPGRFLAAALPDRFLRPIAIQDATNSPLGQMSVRILINAHDRGQVAAANTAHCMHSELKVGARRWHAGESEFMADFFQHALTAAHVAGSAQADLDQMLTAGLQSETVIESGDVKDVLERDGERARNLAQGALWQVVARGLHLLQDGDEVFALLFPVGENLLDLFFCVHGHASALATARLLNDACRAATLQPSAMPKCARSLPRREQIFRQLTSCF